jgi:hypothetical protein
MTWDLQREELGALVLRDFERQRLPGALVIQANVNVGERLSPGDLQFLTTMLRNGSRSTEIAAFWPLAPAGREVEVRGKSRRASYRLLLQRFLEQEPDVTVKVVRSALRIPLALGERDGVRETVMAAATSILRGGADAMAVRPGVVSPLAILGAQRPSVAAVRMRPCGTPRRRRAFALTGAACPCAPFTPLRNNAVGGRTCTPRVPGRPPRAACFLGGQRRPVHTRPVRHAAGIFRSTACDSVVYRTSSAHKFFNILSCKKLISNKMQKQQTT